MRENQKKRKNCKMCISGGHCFLSFPFFNLHKKKWLWTLAVLVLFCFVLVTFATKICSSFSAKRRPIHMRRPYPNGKLTNGWIRCPACGQFDTSPMKYFIRLNWNCAVHFFCFTARAHTKFATFDPSFWQKSVRFWEIFLRIWYG